MAVYNNIVTNNLFLNKIICQITFMDTNLSYDITTDKGNIKFHP